MWQWEETADEQEMPTSIVRKIQLQKVKSTVNVQRDIFINFFNPKSC